MIDTDRADRPADQRGRNASASLVAFFENLAGLRQNGSGGELPQRLQELFAVMRPLLAEEPGTPSAAAPRATMPPTVDDAGLRALFERLAGPLEQARRGGSLTDVWDLAGLGRNEVRTAGALAALWNPKLCGAVAIEFLAAFFARLDPDNLPDRAALEAGYSIRTEDRPLGRADERVDIVVETRGFLVGIEIKIDAPEGVGQLERYRNALQARLRLKIGVGTVAPEQLSAALIYLSLDPDERSDLATIGARWADVAAAARSVVPRQAGDRRFVHQLVAQFAAHVSAF